MKYLYQEYILAFLGTQDCTTGIQMVGSNPNVPSARRIISLGFIVPGSRLYFPCVTGTYDKQRNYPFSRFDYAFLGVLICGLDLTLKLVSKTVCNVAELLDCAHT